MILIDSEMASLKSALNCWEWFGYISTAIVFIGCVGEFVAEFTPLPKSKESRDKLARLSLIVLILGIAGELLGTVRTSQLSGQLIANIEERAGNAEQRAGEANDRASANEKEAAQLRKEAEAEHLARVKIEEKMAWRTISPANERSLVSKLKRFSGQHFTMRTFQDDDEAVNFADIVLKILIAAGWDRKETSHVMAFVHLDGVSVEVAPSRAADFEPAAKALASTLTSVGIDAVEKPSPGEEHEDHASMIHVRIGKKPQRK